MAKSNKTTIPFTGGVNTFNEKGLIEGFTTIKNMRPRRPGFEKRLGMAKHHTTTAHSGEEITSIYHFSKGRRVERHLLAQYEDGTIEDATDQPPTQTTGNFGTSVLSAIYSNWAATTAYSVNDIVFSTSSKLLRFRCTVAGTSGGSEPTWPALGSTVSDGTVTWEAIQGISPATFSSYNDMCIMSDGVNQHQIYTGQKTKPIGFIVYKSTSDGLLGSTTIPVIPVEGADFAFEVTDERNSTYADLASVPALDAATPGALYIVSQVPINKLNITIHTANSNDVGTVTLAYWNGTAYTSVSGLSDGTDTTVPLDTSGSITWTSPTDEQPFYAFGLSGFVYRWSHNGTPSATLSATTKISEVTCEYTGGFQAIRNIWDGILTSIPEVKVGVDVDTATEQFTSESGDAFDPSGLVNGDYIYFSSPDPLFAVYLDVGETPNTLTTGYFSDIETWTGSAWTSISNFYDGTKQSYQLGSEASGKRSGFLSWSRPSTISKLSFRSTQYFAYWYRIPIAGTLDDGLTWSIEGLPYFDIDEINTYGQTNSPWKDRMVYTFDDNYVYITPQDKPMTLNGSQYGLLPVGDGRNNKVLALIPYYNELFAFQEEKGKDGGCVSIIEGKEPSGPTAVRPFDKLVLSTQVGIMNSKSVVYIEDVDVTALTPDMPVFKTIFWLSRYGVYQTNGRVIHNITGNVKNYFDASRTECIRAGYESRHWLGWDDLYKVIRIGLVSGASATEPNVFLVYDPFSTEREKWSTDSFATQASSLSCIAAVEASSGNSPTLQYGGCQDGYVRKLNTGTNDIKADDTNDAIDGDVIFEVSGKGRKMTLDYEVVRMKAQTGTVSETISVDGNTTAVLTDSHDQAGTGSDTYKRIAEERSLDGEHFSIRYRNNTESESMYLLDRGYEFREIENNS